MSTYSSDQRDRALRRLRTANRVVIGGAVVLTGLLTDVAANAFPGHHRTTRGTVPATTSSTSATSATTGTTRTTGRHHHALSRPSSAPTNASPAPAPQSAPQTAAPAPQTVAPAPQTVAPAPLVSGGS